MVNGVESNSKFPHFEGILRLDAALQILYALPVLVCEPRIIVGQQCGSLEGGQCAIHERPRFMLPAVDEELHCPGPSIVRILNNLLQKTIQSYVILFWLFLRDTVVIQCTLKIWPSGYLSRIAFIVTDSGGRRCPK